jgi:hypothetical protein
MAIAAHNSTAHQDIRANNARSNNKVNNDEVVAEVVVEVITAEASEEIVPLASAVGEDKRLARASRS